MSKIKRARRRPDLFSDYDRTLSQRGYNPSTKSIAGIQTYTVPQGVDTITVTMYGAGGGGGEATGGKSGTDEGFGGGSGSKCVFVLEEIKPGTTLTVDVGAGGIAGNGYFQSGDDGGDTTLTYGGITYTAGGGAGGKSFGCVGGSCPDNSGGSATNGDTNTSGNAGSQPNGGASLGDSAGEGGDGSRNHSSQNYTNGGDGKVIFS
jgi:hypothetical protein